MSCILYENSSTHAKVVPGAGYRSSAPDGSTVRQWDGAGKTEHSQVCAPAPTPPACALLVQYTSDLQLAKIREHLLRRAGFDVVSTFAARGCWLPPVGSSIAALFCHTVGESEALRLLTLMKDRATHAGTIRLTRRPACEQGQYDCLLETPIVPDRLIEEATRLREGLRTMGDSYA